MSLEFPIGAPTGADGVADSDVADDGVADGVTTDGGVGVGAQPP
ncbi:hypothetical protein [Rhodoplanes elegans]|nr:hypothetical protein [Rhodoplanes elegans]